MENPADYLVDADGSGKDSEQFITVRELIYTALDKAQARPRADGKGMVPGEPDVLFTEEVLEALKKFRDVSPLEYLQMDARWRAHRLLPHAVITRLDKLTMPPKVASGQTGNKADNLTALVRELAELFHDADQEFYATVKLPNVDGLAEHWETYPLKGRDFRRWAAKVYFQHYETSPGDSAFKDALETLEGFAMDGEEMPVYTRYAVHDAGVFVFLADDDCQVVAISADGWRVIRADDAPVRFRKAAGSKPLPLPVKGDFAGFWDHVNQPDIDTQHLVTVWLLEAMRVDFAFPVLEVIGGQGSAKSTFQRRLCALLDPSKVDLRREPSSTEELLISAKNTHLLCFDNLSALSAKRQDALCIMSTGGGFALRQLYTTSDMEMMDVTRPVIIGGISELVTAPDLGDRIVTVELPKIDTYVADDDLQGKWEAAYPSLLGGLYDLMALALKHLPSVELGKPPRMAAFAKLGQALFRGLNVTDKSFTDVFLANRDRVVNRAIEASPVALAILRLMEDWKTVWSGTTSELLAELTQKYKPAYYDQAAWPRSPRGLGAVLRRVEPSLVLRGVSFERKRIADGWRIDITRVEIAAQVQTEVVL